LAFGEVRQILTHGRGLILFYLLFSFPCKWLLRSLSKPGLKV